MAEVELPARFLRHQTSYRNLGPFRRDRLLGAGFMLKSGSRVDVQDCFPMHYSLSYVLRGRGRYRDESGRDHELAAGDAFQRMPAFKHSLFIDPDSHWVECFVALGTGLQVELAAYGLIDAEQPVLHPGLDLSLASGLATITDRLAENRPRSTATALLEIQQWIAAVYRRHRRNEADDNYEDLLNRACKRLAANLETRDSLPELCAGLGMSYERLRKVFQEHLGQTPGAYRIQCRIDMAASLLREQHLRVKEVAAALGYPSPYAFSAQFRSVTGIRPSQFRA